MSGGFRVALYYAPVVTDPLHAAAASWLGRDAETGAQVPQPPVPGIDEVTAEPRVYGFHSTLKPPMRLRPGCNWADVVEATRALAAQIAPFDLPPLSVQDLHGFLALRETEPSASLQAYADACVAGLDRFRAPPTADEMARRRRASLSPEQRAMLDRWGYPYVFGTWFFHMTLSRRLTPEEKDRLQPEAQRHFKSAVAVSRQVTEICLFTQASPSQPFLIAERVPLQGQPL
jgi:putative phosphonate metabolism protein